MPGQSIGFVERLSAVSMLLILAFLPPASYLRFIRGRCQATQG